MKISFCIPLYNKAFAIKSTVKSIVDTCEKYKINYEIKISNNGSTDITNEELIEKLSMYNNIDVMYVPKTITAPENWFLSLNLGEGDIVKLHLADDLLCDFDFNKLIEKFQNEKNDYVVGKTIAHFENEKFENNYFSDVNKFRSIINNKLSIENKVRIIENHSIYNGVNLFGDINSLYIRKNCIEILKQNFKYSHPSFRTFPDFEIYLRMFITKNGEFLDEYVATYVYNSTSPAIKAKSDRFYRYQAFTFMSNMFIYEFINDMFYRDILLRFSYKTKVKILFILLKKIKEFYVSKN